MKKLELEINGQIVKGFGEKVGKTFWVSVNGKTFKYEDGSNKRNRNTKAAVLNPNEIHAPMPGKITAIKKQSGNVSVGDVVIMMEAMKMEYSLKANKDGKIKKISVKEGDQVTQGQLLVEIE
jgi:acetyl/propionyl-CoA carboxylase alpha subunit